MSLFLFVILVVGSWVLVVATAMIVGGGGCDCGLWVVGSGDVIHNNIYIYIYIYIF